MLFTSQAKWKTHVSTEVWESAWQSNQAGSALQITQSKEGEVQLQPNRAKAIPLITLLHALWLSADKFV